VAERTDEIDFDPISLEGMGDLLSGPDPSMPGSDILSPDLRDPEVARWWTLSEATDALNINERTLRRWIKRGKVDAVKVQGVYGEEWRIKPGPSTERPLSTPGPDIPILTPTRPASPDSPDLLSELLESKVRLSIFEQENRQLREQLQGATFRNGYLEAQLEGREREIKLLTDSQHKSGFWKGFWSWFTGR